MPKISRKSLYAEVSRHVDTQGTKINVAECSRVISSYFLTLAGSGESIQNKIRFLIDELEKAQGKIAADSFLVPGVMVKAGGKKVQ